MVPIGSSPSLLGQQGFRVLMREVSHTRLCAFAKGTYSNLRTQFRCYLSFCVYFERNPLPADIHTICGFAQFLSRSLKPPSIRNYLSGVKLLHIFTGHEYPFTDSFHLHLTIRGIERIHQYVPRRAIPITVRILSLVQSLSHTFSSLHSSVFACGLLLFFTLARAGSILPSSTRTPSSQFLTKQRINFSKEGLLITLIHTKNIQFGRRRLHIPLIRTNSSLCPVNAYLASQSFHLSTQCVPAFVYTDGHQIKWLTKAIFLDTFRSLLHQAGVPDAKSYTGHSFRRGGASWAFQSGIPGELIQVVGDWASDAYKRYIEFTMDNKINLAALLVKGLPN
jgi:hypothetical protein